VLTLSLIAYQTFGEPFPARQAKFQALGTIGISARRSLFSVISKMWLLAFTRR
jgi:hypothetical protein